ncbi:hypothetical protein FLONG3_258 [Fusarium longipes]|uniref:BZIP domain-containing protein n=1 Tax=Fusarium longipes TaxID=694270 RepID=A0A395TAM4_9HYPO|nr:hypothetical protein FLONG3_258 [Fusarium longipes]
MSEATKIKKSKTSVKRNSEARREQNRLASRNYRVYTLLTCQWLVEDLDLTDTIIFCIVGEKRKQKLALLNELLEPSAIPTDVTNNAQINTVQGLNNPGDLSAAHLQDQAFPVAPQTESISVNQGTSNADGTWSYNLPFIWGDLSRASMPASLFHQVIPSTPSLTSSDVILNHVNQDHWGHNMFGLPFQSQDMSKMNYLGPRTVEEVFEDTQESGLSSSQSSSGNDSDDQALNNVLSGVENLTMDQKRTLLRRLQRDTQDSATEAHLPWHQTKPPTPGQLRAIEFAKALYRTAHDRPTLLPAQYTMEAGIFGAMFTNCYALGMASVDDILCEEGCSVFSVTQDQGHHVSQLSLVKSRFQALSPDLRPTDKQLTIGHHPYVDVIPFKSFRENLIQALEHDPPIIDEGILCHDILDGGFICWGAGRNPHGMAAGVPWDSRSWEPKVWFLMKYRELAGDWEGELWKSARWWHSVRGERIQTAKFSNVVSPSGGTVRR